MIAGKRFPKLGGRTRVLIHRWLALAWLVGGLAAFPLGWAYSVAFVTLASVYANVAAGMSASEAADDSELLARLARIERKIDELSKIDPS